MEQRSCFSVAPLCEALSKGRFADLDDPLRALDHFAQPCHPCWDQLATLAEGDSEIDLEALNRHAAKNLQEPPIALTLGRLALAFRQPETGKALPPTHRYLLQKTHRNRSFDFWWLLIEESRLLALNASERQVERWQTLVDTLAPRSSGSKDLDLELELLVLAYKADEIRIEGQPRAAEDLLVDILAQATRCRPEIRATVLEVQADLSRVSLREPLRALNYLLEAEELLKDDRIPGRLAETRMRIGLSLLSQGEAEAAFASFTTALESIPQDTDPRLRVEVLLHLAAIKIRLREFSQVRPYLEEAEPFFEAHASDLMRAQGDWLWGLVYLDENELVSAEPRLVKALQGFYRFGTGLARAQVLANLVQLYIRTRNESRLDRALGLLVAALRQPGIQVHLADQVERVLQDARKSGLKASDLSDLQTRKQWIH